jgi:hypothetical protein
LHLTSHKPSVQSLKQLLPAAPLSPPSPTPAGETEEAIAARKLQFPWGQWIKTGGIGKAKWLAKKVAEAAKKAAAAAAGGCGEGCSSGEHSHGAKAVSSLSDDLDMEGDKDQVREGGRESLWTATQLT